MVVAVSLVFTVELLADADVPPLPPPLVVPDDPVADVLAEIAEVLPVGPVVVAPEPVEVSTAVDVPVALVPVVLIPEALLSRSVPESSDEQHTSSMAPAPSTNL